MSKDLAGLPKGWKVIKLGDISKGIQSGGTPLRNQKSFYEGSIPWVKTLDLNEGVVNCTEEKITEEGFKSIRGKLRPINTVMVAMYGGSGTVGKTGILSISAATNQAVCCIEPNPKVFDSVYLHFYLIGVRKEWMRYAIGTRKDPNISKGIIENTEIILPPLEEQRAIATTLRTIQTSKEARQKELALERERKAALMDYLFTHGTRNEPRKQTEIGEIPESWNVKKLGEIAKIERGKFTHRPRNDSRFYGGSIPFIQTGDVTASNGYITIYSQTLNEKGLLVSKIFPKGTIVITIAANIGYTGILEFDSAFPDSLIGITPMNNISNKYLNYYLLTQQKEMDGKAPQGTQKNINIEFLQPWLTKIPLLEEQQEIADTLSSCDAKIATLEREINLHDELFHSMLEELMTGQLSSLPLA